MKKLILRAGPPSEFSFNEFFFRVIEGDAFIFLSNNLMKYNIEFACDFGDLVENKIFEYLPKILSKYDLHDYWHYDFETQEKYIAPYPLEIPKYPPTINDEIKNLIQKENYLKEGWEYIKGLNQYDFKNNKNRIRQLIVQLSKLYLIDSST